jgi:prepilin-type N-terminal cleavage/methylation domain-containing protein
MRTSARKTSAGFTLIELLTVIAIIGILAAIIIPTVGTVRDKAQRAVDGNNIREILKAATIYAQDNSDKLPDPQTILTTTLAAPSAAYRWPGILAKNNILTDPTFLYAKNDQLFTGTYPTFIIQPSTARNTLHPTFTNGTAGSMAWEFVGGIKMSDPATTPVIYTRGLTTAGTWSPTTGVYAANGGYVAFLGGNVTFYPNTNAPAVFTSNNPTSTSGNKIANIQQAIPFNTANANNSARIYAVPPPGGGAGMIGNALGALATRGP